MSFSQEGKDYEFQGMGYPLTFLEDKEVGVMVCFTRDVLVGRISEHDGREEMLACHL